ncbi:hypothetical protein ACOCJ7_05520 [Knoellia sp. CPCC 206453]|uniref:hypothetical protein n=1 Tax=Knoellia pratensis TaxID=3404796 RepID=UPI003619E2C3
MRRSIATAAFVIAAMALGRLITDHVPLDVTAAEPFSHTGSVGKVVGLEYADVTVTAVHVTPTVMGNPASAAGGRWLIVDTEMLARTAPVTVAGLFLVDGQDRRYIASARGSECATSVKLATGVRSYASVCFDIPKKALTGARLFATRSAYDSVESNFRRDDLADIDLGISASEVDALWAQKDAINVKESSVMPPSEDRR